MSLPREVVPGATYMITRRCTQREFLLKPSARVNQIFMYCLAVAAERTGVIIHATCVLANHHHTVVTDPEGRIPEFYGWLHELVSKSLNSSYGRWENLWASQPTSCVRLLDADAVLNKVVYTLADPVAAALVDRGARWPGVRTMPAQLDSGQVNPSVAAAVAAVAIAIATILRPRYGDRLVDGIRAA